MTKKLAAETPKNKSKKITSNKKKQLKNPKHFTFTRIFIKFEGKYNDFGDDFVGFILKDIREIESKSLISDWQWFNMSDKFKMAFESYKDEELPGKRVQFEGFKETHKKGYYTYQGSVLVSSPGDLEHRVLRPSNIKVLAG